MPIQRYHHPVSNSQKPLYIFILMCLLWSPLYISPANGASLALSVVTPKGNFEALTTTRLSGWACDSDTPTTTLTIEIYDGGAKNSGGQLVGTTLANIQRDDLSTACGAPAHSFIWFFSTANRNIRDGQNHTFYVYAVGTGVDLLLNNSPRSITIPSNANPEGYFDNIVNGKIQGWAINTDVLTQSIQVQFYADGPLTLTEPITTRTFLGSTIANLPNPDLPAVYSGMHRFSWSISENLTGSLRTAFKDGRLHRVYVYVPDAQNASTGTWLPNNPVLFTWSDNAFVDNPKVIFDWKKIQAQCPNQPLQVFPDAPTRVFRDAKSGGRTQLIISQDINTRMVKNSVSSTAASLDGMEFNCNDILLDTVSNAVRSSNPKDFNDHKWLIAPYTKDGVKIITLVHNEFHGWDYPGVMCNTSNGDVGRDCTFTSLLLMNSLNYGDTYTNTTNTTATALVASRAMTYYTGTRGSFGYWNPSNIISKADGYYYSTIRKIYADATSVPQLYRRTIAETCLMRSNNLADPASWRAWRSATGNFDITLYNNPYANLGGECDPLPTLQPPADSSRSGLAVDSITYNAYFQKYIAVGLVYYYHNQTADTGIYYALSSDLINWDEPKPLLKNSTLGYAKASDIIAPIAYPALIDPTTEPDGSEAWRNFQTTGQKPYLYFTRFNCIHKEQATTECPTNNIPHDRDLVRMQVDFGATSVNLCNLLQVTSTKDDGSCGTLRQAVSAANTSPTKTVEVNLSIGSVISLTSGLTLTQGVSITTNTSCGVAGPPVTLQKADNSAGNVLTLSGNNLLYGFWIKGFSLVAFTGNILQCIRLAKQ